MAISPQLFATRLTSTRSLKRLGCAPTFRAPAFDVSLLGLFVPVVLILVAENVGHVKSVAAMTGENLDITGRALFADGISTVFAGAGGGSGTTTYAENIGVMAATRVYSTVAYVVAAVIALGLSMLRSSGRSYHDPAGVLGNATILYGMIGCSACNLGSEPVDSLTRLTSTPQQSPW